MTVTQLLDLRLLLNYPILISFLMEKERRNGNRNRNCNNNNNCGVDQGNGDRRVCRDSFPISSSSSSSSSSVVSFIQHPVSKMDTLAGIAIKYGVEVSKYPQLFLLFLKMVLFNNSIFQVADIKKMNGLVTDLQMFALKYLHIPLPGRHPPSPCLSNGYVSFSFPCQVLRNPIRVSAFYNS